MTILYILISSNAYGGASKSFLAMLKGVIQAGHRATVVVPSEGPICPLLRDMGAEIWVIPYRSHVWTNHRTLQEKLLFVPRQLGRILLNWKADHELARRTQGLHFDLIHSNNSTTLLGYHLAKRLGTPHIFHIREYGDKDFGLTYFPTNRSFYRLLQEKNVYSICITRDIQKHFGLTGSPFSRVIYNGIIPDMSCLVDTHTPRTFFLYAGRLERTKGLTDLIDAYYAYTQRVASPLPLHVAGEAIDLVYEKEVKQRIERYRLTDHVAFLGKVVDMDSLYTQALATIIPSYSEGFGRCMPEAMTHGSIAIGRNTGGTKEQLDNGLELSNAEIGLRFASLPEFADALIRVHTMSDNDKQQIVENAYHCVSTLYSEEQNIHNILTFYNQILTQ